MNEEKITSEIYSNDILNANLKNESLLVGTLDSEKEIKTQIISSNNLETSLTNSDNLNANLNPGFVKVTTNKHDDLLNRDLQNQHPIESITGLKQELLSIKNNHQQVLLSIKKIETKIQNKVRTTNFIPMNMETGEYIFLEKESDN